MTSAVLGGTGSVLGGGKFANGAVTGAYGYLFNELSHGLSKEQAGYERRMSRLGFADAVDQWATGYGMDIRVPIDSFDLRVASPSASWREGHSRPPSSSALSSPTVRIRKESSHGAL